MSLGENIRHTLNSIFDLYKVAAGKLYGFSIIFSLISTFMSIVLAAIVCIIALYFIDSSLFSSEKVIEELFFHELTMNRISDITKAIAILNIGVFGIFLLGEIDGEPKENYTIRDLFKNIPSAIWNLYFILLFIILLINLLLFRDILDFLRSDRGMLFDLYDPSDRKLKFYIWFSSFVQLLKDYIPYLMAMLLILYYYKKNITWANIRNYRTAFLTALILSFCIDVLSHSVIYYFRTYIFDLITIPFVNVLIPGIIGFVLIVLLSAFFYPGLAASFAFPFKNEEEEVIVSSDPNAYNL